MDEQVKEMEYLDADGKVYKIGYSQKLLRDVKVVGIILSVLVVIMIVLFGILLSGGTLTKILHNLVC